MKDNLKGIATTLLVTGLLLVITLPCFSFNANANGVGTIEVKLTLYGKVPLLNADVVGEDVNTHEIYEGISAKNGTYYINIWFDFHYPKTINVKVVTKHSGIQEETVYDLRQSDLVQLQFDFGFKDKARVNHWNFPVLRILQVLLSPIF